MQLLPVCVCVCVHACAHAMSWTANSLDFYIELHLHRVKFKSQFAWLHPSDLSLGGGGSPGRANRVCLLSQPRPSSPPTPSLPSQQFPHIGAPAPHSSGCLSPPVAWLRLGTVGCPRPAWGKLGCWLKGRKGPVPRPRSHAGLAAGTHGVDIPLRDHIALQVLITLQRKKFSRSYPSERSRIKKCEMGFFSIDLFRPFDQLYMPREFLSMEFRAQLKTPTSLARGAILHALVPGSVCTVGPLRVSTRAAARASVHSSWQRLASRGWARVPLCQQPPVTPSLGTGWRMPGQWERGTSQSKAACLPPGSFRWSLGQKEWAPGLRLESC